MPTCSLIKILPGLTLSLVLSSAAFLIFTNFNKKSSPDFTKTTRPPLLQSQFTSKGVSNRILQIKINFDEVALDDKTVEVTAEINTPFDFKKSLNYKWKFGEGISIIEGSPFGEVTGLSKDESTKVKIKVKGFSKEKNRQLGFEIFGTLNGNRVHGDSLVASDLDNTFENTVQNVERIKAAQ